jgi:hypothetical protein
MAWSHLTNSDDSSTIYILTTTKYLNEKIESFEIDMNTKISRNVDGVMQNGSLASINYPLRSYSGKYEATIEEFDDAGVNSYKLYICDADYDIKYEADMIFRARDKNYILWADDEDILWVYSGDVGTFFWIKDDVSWVKKSYADNGDARVPKALKEARPKYYN